MDKAWQAIEAGRAATTKTQREKDGIALPVFFKDYDKVDLRTRTLAYEAAMARLAERYSDDTEATRFYGAPLMKSSGTRPMPSNSAPPLRSYRPSEVKQPNHPGIPHYIITATTSRPFADKAYRRRSATRHAPAVPHAAPLRRICFMPARGASRSPRT